MPKVKRFAVLAILSLVAVVVWRIDKDYVRFQKSLGQIRGVELKSTREEVLYRLGIPTHVIDPERIDSPEIRGLQRVYTVNAEPSDVNRMPEGKRVADYFEWQFESIDDPARLTVVFGQDGRVQSLSIYCTEGRYACWEPIAGIESADDEDRVLRLGEPRHVKMESATKTVSYEDIGITVFLTRGKAYMVKIEGSQERDSMHIAKFLRSLL